MYFKVIMQLYCYIRHLHHKQSRSHCYLMIDLSLRHCLKFLLSMRHCLKVQMSKFAYTLSETSALHEALSKVAVQSFKFAYTLSGTSALHEARSKVVVQSSKVYRVVWIIKHLYFCFLAIQYKTNHYQKLSIIVSKICLMNV